MPSYLITVAPRTAPNSSGVIQSLYLLAGAQLSAAAVERLVVELLHDPVVQQVAWRPLTQETLIPEPFSPEESEACCLEIAYRPGVTDNEGESVLEGARRLEITGLEQARALRRYLLSPDIDPRIAARDLANDLVQTTLPYP
ncbi:MAG: phosphoribosylformylglycinamidine synthase subunit PurL, partial [Chloroflexales bacterium]|nr:phosphoribosylformylglycinamidine synthase subunit PurL [Chloroflexales bacterium]